MSKTITEWIGTILVVGGILFAGFMLNSCETFQRTTFTDMENDVPLSRLYELCLKAQTAKDTAGGNVEHCKPLLESITPRGKFDMFEDCVKWSKANKKDAKEYKINCKQYIVQEKKED